MLRKQCGRSIQTAGALRSGISILEVLVSIGILVLGLLGVVVLIPIAAQNLRRGMTLDDSTAVARAGMADIQARGGNNIKNWLRYQPGGFTQPTNSISNLWGVQTSNSVNTSSFVHPSWAFCIDPMMYETAIVQDGSNRDPGLFPYQPRISAPAFPVQAEIVAAATPTLSGRMVRVTMNWPTFVQNIDWRFRTASFPDQMSVATDPAFFRVGLANSMCVSSDDLLLTSPGQEPMQGLVPTITVNDVDRPASQFDASQSPVDLGMQSWDAVAANERVQRKYDGKISWFATLVPLPGSMASGVRYYTLSVIVVERRDMTIDMNRETLLESPDEVLQDVESERTVGIRFVDGLGGGEVQLVSYRTPDPVASDPNDLSNNTLLAKKSLSRVREGNWILVSGPSGGAAGHIFYWYRVGSVDNEPARNPASPDEIIRAATIRGPDWPNVPAYATGMYEATIVSNVINVFEQTVELRGE
jgi:hypothetical protein